MNTRTARLAALMACFAVNPAIAARTPASEAAAVVTSFCDAVTSRDMNKVLGFLAPGSVQFSLRPSHAGMGGPPSALTSDLRAHWSTVGPVLFTATKAYTRKAEIIDSRVDGDIATVWAKVTTQSVRGVPLETKTDQFVEVYLLVRKDGPWQIGAIADNRRPNDVGLGSPKP